MCVFVFCCVGVGGDLVGVVLWVYVVCGVDCCFCGFVGVVGVVG